MFAVALNKTFVLKGFQAGTHSSRRPRAMHGPEMADEGRQNDAGLIGLTGVTLAALECS